MLVVIEKFVVSPVALYRNVKCNADKQDKFVNVNSTIVQLFVIALYIYSIKGQGKQLSLRRFFFSIVIKILSIHYFYYRG